MAEDETKNRMLQTLTDDKMGKPPAVQERPREPSEPVEPRETREIERGRRPEEVVQPREPSEPATSQPERKYKIRVAKTDKGDVHEELTLDQIAKRGLMDTLVQSANQLPSVSQKYQEALEKLAATKDDKPAVEQPRQLTEEEQWEQHKTVTAQVMQKYGPQAAREVDFYVKAGLIESDLPEAYANAVRSLFAIQLFHLDLIQELNKISNAQTQWIRAEVDRRNADAKQAEATKVRSTLDDWLDEFAKKADGKDGNKLYAGLKDEEIRGKFVEWLTNEVDPKQTALTKENVERFWMAYNVPELKTFAKEVAEKAVAPTPRVKAAGDGQGTSQTGGKETVRETTLLDRLTDTRLGAEA